MIPFVAGISFKTAPVELRERLAVPASQLKCCGCWLKVKAGLSEVVLLSTCNRVEMYGVAKKGARLDGMLNHLSRNDQDVSDYVYVHEKEAAARHLFAVTSGLDSMVLGETEITGQVKHAYQTAHDAGLTGRVMNCLFQKALQTAKEIRTRTQVGRGAASVGSIAVELAEKIFGAQLTGKTVMIVGAGKMGEACVRHLGKKGVRSVIVSNRSLERAAALAAELNGQAIRLDECTAALAEADIVVTSTGCPQIVLSRRDLEQAMTSRKNRPLFLIDIAVPRNIDPGAHDLENVYLYDVDDLQELVRERVRVRVQELASCRVIIEKQCAALMNKLSPQPKKLNDEGIQSEPGWTFCRPAVCCG